MKVKGSSSELPEQKSAGGQDWWRPQRKLARIASHRHGKGRAEENRECKVLKGWVSSGNPRVTGTERRERRAGEPVVGGGQGSHLWRPRGFLSSSLDGPVSSPTLSPLSSPTLSLSSPTLSPWQNWGGGRKVTKTEFRPPQGIRAVNNGWVFTFHLRTGGFYPVEPGYLLQLKELQNLYLDSVDGLGCVSILYTPSHGHRLLYISIIYNIVYNTHTHTHVRYSSTWNPLKSWNQKALRWGLGDTHYIFYIDNFVHTSRKVR